MILSAPSDIWMQSHANTIDDIPNELVYLILGNLGLEELIPLGCVSRKFNMLAFTFYFSLVHGAGVRHLMTTRRALFSTHYTFDHTTYPEGTALAGRTQRHPFCTLSALRLAILVKQPVYSIGAQFTFARFLEEADHLQKYLRTAPELVSLQLTLPTNPVPYFGGPDAPPLYEVTEAHYRALYRVLEGLQTVIPKSSGLTWIVSGNFTLPLDAAPYTGAPLKNLRVVLWHDCRFLSSPPLKDWTIASLQQSHLQILEIDANILAPFHDSIHLPHVFDLKIRAFTAPAFTAPAVCFSLGAFLSRHPGLKNVAILSDKKPGAGGCNHRLEDNALPNVVTISAPIEYLILWLANTSALSSVSAVNAISCVAMKPVNFANILAPEQISAACALTCELLGIMAGRPTVSSFLFPLCELRRGGNIFPAGLDISHIHVLHCTPEYLFEMTAEAAEEVGARLVGFTGLKKLVVNQNRRSHDGWIANLGPKLREGVLLQLIG